MHEQYVRGALFALTLIGVPGIAYSQAHGFVYSNGTYTSIPNQPNVDGVFDSGINNAGQVVGYGNNNGQGGFIYSNGTYTALQAPQSMPNETLPRGVNDAGQIVGDYYVDTPHGTFDHGFLLSNGGYTTIQDPNAFVNTIFGFVIAGTAVMDINNLGDIVGYYQGTGGSIHGFLYSDGIYTDIDVPGSIYSRAMAINDYGQIIGDFANVGGQYRSFIYSNGIYTTDPLPGGETSYGINNYGDIVGGDMLLTHDGQLTTFDFPHNPDDFVLEQTIATGINDKGQVVGIYIGYSVPELSTWAMMVLGFAGLGLAGYRRARGGLTTFAA